MTDNDIIKALECCRKPVGQACKECPLNSKGVDCLDFDIDELVLDLINRQKAEIEDLRHEIRNLECEKGQLEGTTEYLIEQAKIEAVKEFAERLTDKADLTKVNAFDSKWVISQEDIDNLVKEMVGEGIE